MPRRDDAAFYEKEMGRPPTLLPDDHPDRWQWDYRGTKAEREELLDRLDLSDEAPVVLDGQEEMF